MLGTGGAITWKAVENSLDDENKERDCLKEGNESVYDGEYDNADRGLEAYENESGIDGDWAEKTCENSKENYEGEKKKNFVETGTYFPEDYLG